MSGAIKNILIFAALGALFVFIFIFFIKGSGEEDNTLTSTVPGETGVTTTSSGAPGAAVDQDFLPLLLSVKSIKLDDSIFSDIAFTRLRDSSIVLTPDGNEGRPNPFAPIGSDTGGTAPQSTP